MPYIKIKTREELRPSTKIYAKNSGDLNYQLTMVIRDYLIFHGKDYKTLNDIIGALECCKQEFVRRVVNPYEDTKIILNGDVYD